MIYVNDDCYVIATLTANISSFLQFKKQVGRQRKSNMLAKKYVENL